MTLPFKEFWYDWGGLNTTLFNIIYGYEVSEMRALLPYLDFVGEYTHFPYLLLATTLMFMMKLMYRKLRGFEVGGFVYRSYGSWLAALILGFVMMAVIVGGAKEFLDFPRPYVAMPDSVSLLYGIAKDGDGYKSFPSGHVAFTALWVTLLWSQVWGIFKPLLILTLFGACWFRVAVGAHFPMDVIVSLVIGIGCANLWRRWMMRKFKVWR